MSRHEILFHLPPDWACDLSRALPFYRTLIAGLRAEGIACDLRVLDRARVLEAVERDSAFHILNHGQISHPRVLNAGIAYIYPFWNLDPKGIRAFSSIADLPFRPARLDQAVARDFFNRLHRRLVQARQSRYEQPQVVEALPEAEAAVFLQSEDHRLVGETCYLDGWTMLETVLGATSGPVIVKPHPRDRAGATAARLQDLRRRHPRLHVSTGNIHDIIAASARVVTINSAVGVETYLHRKPVILCGRTDFHHIATTCQSAQALEEALRAPAPARQYAKYIHWYFGQMCLNAGAPDLTARFLARVRATGYPL